MKEIASNFELVDLGSTKDGKRKVVGFDEPIKEGNCFVEPSNDGKPITLSLTDQRGRKGKTGKARPKGIPNVKTSCR